MENQNLTIEQLKKYIYNASFNVAGRRPVSSKWLFSEQDLNKEVTELSKSRISEVEFVSLISDKSGGVDTIVWFNEFGKHFRNNSTANTALGKGFTQYSKELLEFIAKFGDGGNQKPSVKNCLVSPGDGDNRPLRGVRIDLLKYMQIILDSNNEEYSKLFGGPKRKTCNINLSWHFKPYKNIKYDTIEFLEVEKTERVKKQNEAPITISQFRH